MSTKLPSRCVARLLLAVATLTFTASSLAAQDQPAAFVHGFASDGSSWQAAASQISSDLRIQAYTPNLPWNLSYATQAGVLATALAGAGPNVITAGHSNGAIVSRFLNRDHGSPNDRIVSVGTPHLGTGLAYSALNGDIAFWGARVAGRIGTTINVYSYWELAAGIESPWDLAWFAFHGLGIAFQYLSSDLADLGYASPGMGIQVPVLEEMVYNSSSLGTINDPTNLARESSAMFARVGIRIEIDSPRDLVFRVVDPVAPGSADDMAVYKDLATFAALAAFYYYDAYPVYAPHALPLRANRYMWLDLAAELDFVDVNYLNLMGALSSYVDSDLYYWYQNDGVVRSISQQYPGGTRQVLIANGPLHMEQKQNDRVIEELFATFEGDFGVPSRSQPPPPPPPSPPVLTAALEQAGPVYRPRLTWGAVPSATSYRVYRRLKQGGVEGTWHLWQEVTTTTLLDITVVNQYLGGSPVGAIEYVGYHVKAVGASGESVQSQEHYFRPDGEAPQRVGGGVGLDVQQP